MRLGRLRRSKRKDVNDSQRCRFGPGSSTPCATPFCDGLASGRAVVDADLATALGLTRGPVREAGDLRRLNLVNARFHRTTPSQATRYGSRPGRGHRSARAKSWRAATERTPTCARPCETKSEPSRPWNDGSAARTNARRRSVDDAGRAGRAPKPARSDVGGSGAVSTRRRTSVDSAAAWNSTPS